MPAPRGASRTALGRWRRRGRGVPRRAWPCQLFGAAAAHACLWHGACESPSSKVSNGDRWRREKRLALEWAVHLPPSAPLPALNPKPSAQPSHRLVSFTICLYLSTVGTREPGYLLISSLQRGRALLRTGRSLLPFKGADRPARLRAPCPWLQRFPMVQSISLRAQALQSSVN